MAELLLVRSGNAEDPVAGRFEMASEELSRLIGSRQLYYLGVELAPIGETSRVSEFSDPGHVVVNVGASEAGELSVADQGFYVVEGLTPAEVTEPED